jgi:hypothetical protein
MRARSSWGTAATNFANSSGLFDQTKFLMKKKDFDEERRMKFVDFLCVAGG